jgi:two-component system chemotaxis sensor kinase CheA
VSRRVDLAEFLSAYVAEADEQLTSANAKLLTIEAAQRRGESSPRAVRDLFRSLHTIKGLSAMVGVEAVVTIAHKMETVLRAADRSGGSLATGAVDTLLEGVRAIEQRVRALEGGKPVAAPPGPLLAALDALEDANAPEHPGEARLQLDAAIASKLAPFERDQLLGAVTEGKRALRVDFTPSAERAAAGMTINSVRERVGAIAEIVRVVPISVAQSEQAPGGLAFALLVVTAAGDEDLAAAAGADARQVMPLIGPAEEPAALAPIADDDARAADDDALAEAPREEDSHRRNVLRVDVARVDEAMEQLSALIVTRSRLNAAIAKLDPNVVDTRALRQVAAENGRQLRDLRGAILRVRMVPITEVLERVPIIVRALKRASGKLVRLEIDGGGAELDKAVAERIFPAIVHLVRNAVDHAIESPEERRAAGKPEEGLLRIVCSARSNTRLELTVTDDGRGIDRAAIARRSGHEAPESDAALLAILCSPGFSTRAHATTTSGRGMGMDIVKRVAVDQLGGALLLETTPGRGTSFSLHVPLTIAIVDAFTLECASQRFVAPVSVVEEIVEIDPAAIIRAPSGKSGGAGGGRFDMVARRGQAMPLIELATLLRLKPAGGPPSDARDARAPARKALVVRRSGEAVAFVLDRVLGQQEAVVRPLLDPLVTVRGISGATDLGDGRPTLVLDFVALASAGAEGPMMLRGAAPPALPGRSS